RFPQEQRVEELARLAAAASAARRDGFAAIVAAADDLALRGARFDAPRAILEHRIEKVPRAVVAKRQQAFVDGSERELGSRHRLAALRDPDAHQRLLPDRVLWRVGRDAHLQRMLGNAD